MAFDLPNFIPAIPEIFMLCMTCVVLLAELFVGRRYRNISYILAQLTLVVTAALTLRLYALPETITFSGTFILDPLASVLKLMTYLVTFFVLLYSRPYVRDRNIPFGEYQVLALFSVLGMMVLISAHNFISLYLGLELLSLPLYAMIALHRDSDVSGEAAMKYFVMGAVASGMLLYGLSMIYGATASLDISIVAQVVASKPVLENQILVFGLVFLVVGLAFKLGAVPFHMWVPDIYEGSPSAVTLFISTAPKIAAFAMMVRLLVDTLPVMHVNWAQLLMIISILSMALGNFVAIVQTNFKRMLAYSSIAHMGYMLLGFLAGTSTGYAAAMFYILNYTIMSLGAFGMIVLLSRAGFEAENISDLKGLNARNPWLALMLLLIMFSMAGLPPLVGFFAKLAVLESLIGAGLVWLAALALLFAIVGAYYYLRVVKAIYFDKPLETTPIKAESRELNVAMSINGLALLALGLFPWALFRFCLSSF